MQETRQAIDGTFGRNIAWLITPPRRIVRPWDKPSHSRSAGGPNSIGSLRRLPPVSCRRWRLLAHPSLPSRAERQAALTVPRRRRLIRCEPVAETERIAAQEN